MRAGSPLAQSTGFLIAAFVFLGAAELRAQSPAAATDPLHAPTDVRHLKLGDRYQVLVERDRASRTYDGRLVKVTDRWLVLASVAEDTSVGVPMRNHSPLGGPLFRNVGIGRSSQHQHLWLPREAATVQGRTIVTTEEPLPTIAGNGPPRGTPSLVEFIEEGRLENHRGEVSITPQGVSCTVMRSEVREVPWPVLGNLPLVGSTFTSQLMMLHSVEHQLESEKVLCVRVNAPRLEEPVVE